MDELLSRITNDQYLYQIKHYKSSAWLGHAPFMKFIVRELKPKIFVELGTHNGFSYFVGCQAIVESGLTCKAFAVDHWIGDAQAGFFSDSIFQEVSKTNEEYIEFSTLLKMSFSEATHFISDQSVDLLHIDGFHTFESVSEDFYSWLPKMNKDGIVLLHDIHVRRDTFGVHKLWSEIKGKYKTIEFVGSHGLGVVFLGAIPDGLLSELFDISAAGNLAQIQGTFGSISDSVIQTLLLQSASLAIDSALNEKNLTIIEIGLAIQERDNAIRELDLIKQSSIWRATKFLRKIKNLLP
jgi:hypothetical protein